MKVRHALAATVLVGLGAIAAWWWGTHATEKPPAASSTPARAAPPTTRTTATAAADVANAPSDRGGSRTSPRHGAQTHPDGEASSATGRGSRSGAPPSASAAATAVVAEKPAPTAPADPNVSTRSVGPSGETGVGTLTVIVTDGDGRPLSGVRLEIKSTGAGANGATSAIDLGAEGRTELRGCSPGRVTLDLTVGDLHRVVVANVVAGEESEVTVRMVAAKDVTVEATAPVTDGVVVAAPPEGAGHKEHADSGVVRGRIVESDTEKPIPGLEVRINGTELLTTTGDDGNFRLEGVDPGAQQIILSKDGFEYRIVDASVVAGKEVVVDEMLKQAATLRLNLTRRDGRAYVGRATLLVSQTIAPGVGYGTNHSITAGEDGSAVFRQIVPGSYKVKVFAGRIASASVDVKVPLGATTLDLTLE
jgi:hypothetical protein